MDYQILKNHPLAAYTTLKIGGPADTFIEANNPDQLISILNSIYQINPSKSPLDRGDFHHQTAPCPVKGRDGEGFPTILGNGSNVLISDSGIRGLVIRYFNPLQSIIKQTINDGLVGLENFAYIPASLGGAIVSNIHGADKNNFNQYLNTITIFDLSTSTTITLQASDLKWGYDYSEFQDKPNLIILSATFNLQKGDKIATLDNYQKIIDQKSLTQPMNSAGCVFKNPSISKAGLPAETLAKAGQIIDELGWKGKFVGGAQVSEKHANFIINTGNATAKDYYTLMTQIQSDVLAKKGIRLEPEIKLLGKF